MGNKLLILILLLTANLCAENLLIRKADVPGRMEIAARMNGEHADGRFMIYSFPQKGNPGEREIAEYFQAGFPVQIDGACLVATIVPEQRASKGSERCDLYLTFRMPELDIRDIQSVDNNPTYDALANHAYEEEISSNIPLMEMVISGLRRHYRYFDSDLSFKALAWLDPQGKPIVNESGCGLRTSELTAEVSGLLGKMTLYGYSHGSSWEREWYVRLPAAIRNFCGLGKRYVFLKRSSVDGLQVSGDQPFYDPRLFPENPFFAAVAGAGKSLFRFAFTQGSIRFQKEIAASGWRELVVPASIPVDVVIMKGRKLNKLQEVWYKHQTWELVLFAAFCLAILLFYFMQYWFVRGCEGNVISWGIAAGASLTATVLFWVLWRRDFSPSLAGVFYANCALLILFAVSALVYAWARKKGKAIFASATVLLELLLIWSILQMFRTG